MIEVRKQENMSIWYVLAITYYGRDSNFKWKNASNDQNIRECHKTLPISLKILVPQTNWDLWKMLG